MIKHFKTIAIILSLVAFVPTASYALDAKQKDDKIIFTLSAKDWVTTKTARVFINVEAAVTQKTANNMRKKMINAVNSVAKSDWRLVNFRRNQDKTGMEHWSASFEARLPEIILSSLNEQAKKKSIAGMQIKIRNIDFSPTLEERQEVKNKLRRKIYELAKIQLDEFNKTTNKLYRIAMVDFTGRAHAFRNNRSYRNMEMMADKAMVSSAPMPSIKKSEKVIITATIILAAKPENKIVQ